MFDIQISYIDALNIVARHQAIYPVDLMAIAKDLQVNVYHVNQWSDDLSGMILKSSQYGGVSGYAIFLNEKHHPNRRRFTLAHELSHLILHKDLIGDGITDDAMYRSGLSNALEAQANSLAADILMPWHLLNQAMQNGKTQVSALARDFAVSEHAMSIRLGVPAF